MIVKLNRFEIVKGEMLFMSWSYIIYDRISKDYFFVFSKSQGRLKCHIL